MGRKKQETTVEEILHKRKRNGRIEYLIKWRGYNEDHNSWEPKKNIKCQTLLARFEADLKEIKEKLKQMRTQKNMKKDNDSEKFEVDGFEKGFEADQIFGATIKEGLLYFLIKWKNLDGKELVAAKRANIKCPQIVIDFYERITVWSEQKNEP